MTNLSNGTTDLNKLFRSLPSVDALLTTVEGQQLLDQYGRSLTIEALRHALEQTRKQIRQHRLQAPPTEQALLQKAQQWVAELVAPTLRAVINATGVIVHTNLGRAPLSQASIAAVTAVSAGYSNLEYDLASGSRGSRAVHAEQLLQKITGAESALVVNNNAAAVLLMLTALCQGKEVIISRSQLVEIGGGFRIPDVMAQSGARLVEVGTTNRTHLRDYANAISENTGALLVAHYSNFKIVGFTTEPSLPDLAELAHAHQIPMLYDQGSGALYDTAVFGLDAEPTVIAGVEAGCDVIAFSGDKLLGGPQAGILCGSEAAIAQMKRHPLARAVRADKLCLAGLTATLQHHVQEQYLAEVPVWWMMSQSVDTIADRAQRWVERLQAAGVEAEMINGRSTVGGGSLPGTSLATKLVALQHSAPDKATRALRQTAVPIISRIQDDQVVLDPRTVLPHQENLLLQQLIETFGQPNAIDSE